MNTFRVAILVAASAAFLLFPGCAASPEAEARRQATEADIDEILSYELDPTEYGEIKNCLADHEYTTFKPLGTRHMLFEGRRGKLWINALRGRCNDLRHGDVLVVRVTTGSRMCDMDHFEVTEWFNYPWYRRWPWSWGRWGTGTMCTLGKFHPVSEQQVSEIRAVLESR